MTTRIEQAAAEEFEGALRQCGVTDAALTPTERDALDRVGYVVLPGVMAPDWLAALRAAFEKAMTPARPSAGKKETGTRHTDGLVGQDPAFDGIFTQPSVLAAVHHVLGCPFRVAQSHGRDPLPGYGQQGLHADWMARAASEPFRIVTTIWLLDDFEADNGATRVVPGTHRLLRPPPKALAAPANRHPDQTVVVAPAGSVLVFNGHLWHSGTRNESNRSRRVVQCSFVAREEARFQSRHEALERLSPAARYLLGG